MSDQQWIARHHPFPHFEGMAQSRRAVHFLNVLGPNSSIMKCRYRPFDVTVADGGHVQNLHVSLDIDEHAARHETDAI